jgi:glycosyltransferase involved in cell wall biosynthesis
LEPALEALGRRYPSLSLRVICSEPFESRAIPVENVPWSLADEVTQLRGLHIGLMPLDDDAWTRGKCAYKALQYMAAGIPVVSSPVGMNTEVVTDGATGLLAADLDSWERQIARLLDSPSLRRQIGEAGQRAVLQRYSLDRMAPRLADLIGSTVKAGRGSR